MPPETDLPENSRVLLHGLGILFTVLLFLGCFAIGARYSLLNQVFYQKIITGENISGQLSSAYAQSIDQQTYGSSQTMSEVIPADILQVILPADWVEDQTQDLITSIIDSLNLKTPGFSYTLDLTAVKNTLQGDTRTEIAAAILSGMPDCSAEVVNQLAEAMLQGNLSAVEACKPPDPFYSLALPLVSGMVSATGAALPDSIAIGQSTDGENGIAQGKFFETYRWIRILLGLAPWGILVISLCLLAVGFTGTRYAFRVLGYSGIIAGIASILGALLFSGIAGLFWMPLIRASGIPLVQAIFSLIEKKLLLGYGKTVLICALVCIVTGLLFLRVNKIAKKI